MNLDIERNKKVEQGVEHDREMIEASFNSDRLFTPEEMKERFGKYGWGK